MKAWGILVVVMLGISTVYGQKYFTKKGKIAFTSEAIFEKIEAINHEVVAVWDWEAGNFEFSVPIRSFAFEKSLMQTHFNENYLESDRYPYAYFKGKIGEKAPIAQSNQYRIQIAGDLTIHGVTQPIVTQAVVEVTSDRLKGEASFSIAVADYQIEIPWIVREKVAKVVDISVKIDCEPLK
jgi:polyisoprenoid-binding protein YceI